MRKRIIVLLIIFALLSSTAYAQWFGAGAWGQIRRYLQKVGVLPKTIQFTITEPDQLDASDALIVWSNESKRTFTINEISGWADVPTNIILKMMDEDGADVTTVADFSIDTVGTSIYWDLITGMSESAIPNRYVLFIDATTSAPDHVKITIKGRY